MSENDGPLYELVFAHAETDAATSEPYDVVLVRPTGARGPAGHPVYGDATGIVRAEISDQGEVRMLLSGGHQAPRTPLTVRRVDPS
ncbi:DUF6296 family protein [Kitasatospora sp. GAS204B]|uniref:DUF6296 family protein n=1 Tax=unclassified Kitasatospora TaxID=2633591 RepID=UPI002474C93D|nr:DUF6296 family protein [Kitasatospora sp. GAS204B]MDH6117704.1 hypothetical protein [Kitasatospora sp. GAS204B]